MSENINKKTAAPKNVMAKIYTIIGFLIVLSILLLCIGGVVDERISFKNEAAESVAKTWGKAQFIEIPVIRYQQKDKDGYSTKTIQASSTNTEANINVELKKKGIYKVPAYIMKIKQKGEIKNSKIKNSDAVFSFKVSDPKGFIKKPVVKIGGREIWDCYSYECNIYIRNEETIPYEIEYTIRGTKEVTFEAGGANETHITSNWLEPEFKGDFSPVEHREENGTYKVHWSIPEAASATPSDIVSPRYSAAFHQAVDSHRMTERCVKYGFLFIALTFLAFFVYEIINEKKRHIHPFQYSLIGVSMLVFYLLLLSMSEFISFWASYLTASVMTILLITLYTHFVLTNKEDKKFSLTLGGILSAIYLYLYVTVNLKEFSLLAGSFGLFFTIILVMYTTRNVEWYKEN